MTPYAADPRDLAAELSPNKVHAYLDTKGYRLTGDWPDVSLHRRDSPVPEMPVEVPLNPDLADYGRRMLEALESLDGAFLGLLHAIDPQRFPRERILALAGVAP